MTKNQRKILSSIAIIVIVILVFLFSEKIINSLQNLKYTNQDSVSNAKIENKLDNYNNDDWQGEEYPEFKKQEKITGKKFMVSTLDKRASEAGAKMLKKGGNAIDAAIAAQLVLNVVEPQ